MSSSEAASSQGAAARGRQTRVSNQSDSMLIRDRRTIEGGYRRLHLAEFLFQIRARLALLTSDDLPIADLLGRSAWQDAVINIAAFSMAADPRELSLRDLAALEFGEDRVVAGGLGQVVADHARGLPIRRNHRVDRIDWRSANLIALEGTFGRLTARAVIITVPPPVLASGTIKFIPKLPDAKSEAISHLHGGRFNKCMIRLEKPADLPTFAYDMDGAGAELMVRTEPLPLLTLIASGDACEQLPPRSGRALHAYATNRVAKFFGGSVAALVADTATYSWNTDPFALGAYSRVSVGHASARNIYAEPIDERLFFVGEAAAGPWALTVGGAHVSGHVNARKVSAVLAGR